MNPAEQNIPYSSVREGLNVGRVTRDSSHSVGAVGYLNYKSQNTIGSTK